MATNTGRRTRSLYARDTGRRALPHPKPNPARIYSLWATGTYTRIRSHFLNQAAVCKCVASRTVTPSLVL